MQRRAANTPSRDRRKSGRVQRESTFDVLKTLGKGMLSCPEETELLTISANMMGNSRI